MAWSQFYSIDHYRIFLRSREHPSFVRCYYGNNASRWLTFFLIDSEDLPPDTVRQNGERINVYLPANRYAWCVDMLRNEGPHWFNYNDDPVQVVLKTGQEQPAEGEL